MEAITVNSRIAFTSVESLSILSPHSTGSVQSVSG